MAEGKSDEVGVSDENEMWENLFSERYTEEDKEYVKVKDKQLPPQPTCFPWIIQSRQLKRGWEWTRHRDRNRRDWDRNRRSHHDASDNPYRDRSSEDRDRRNRSSDDREHHRDRDYDRERHHRNYDDRDHYSSASKRMRK